MLQQNIKRNEFLKSLGLKGATLLAVYCGVSSLSSCQNESGVLPTTGSVDFTLDLNNTTYSALQTVGNSIVVNSVVIARVSSSAFAAVTQICSHEGQKRVAYQKNGNTFYCDAHGASFSISGAKLNNVSNKGITSYQTTLTNNSLRVFS